MDLETRKYHLIEELFKIEKESVIASLEKVLKREISEDSQVSTAQKKELDKRLKNYKNNPDNVLEWEEIKDDW